MAVTHLDIAKLCNAIYAADPLATGVDWKHLDDGTQDDGVIWGLAIIENISVVVFRGSVTGEDFARDLETAYWPDRDLGPVHLGFLQGIKDVWDEVAPALVSGAWVATGHSLGAARASLLAALGIVRGISPRARVVFGEPRAGFDKLQTILSALPAGKSVSYRNGDDDGHDRVTDVPFFIPEIFPYVHPTTLIDVSEPPSDPTDKGPFRYHHMPLYLAAIQKFATLPEI